jgi:tetratricopeptide (TPR) repeat protein
LFEDHKNDEAITAYSRAIDLDPQNARAFALRAWAFSRKRDNVHELQDAERAVALDPQLALAHKSLGYAYISMGQADRGIAEANIAIGLDPALAAAYSDRGVGHYQKKNMAWLSPTAIKH